MGGQAQEDGQLELVDLAVALEDVEPDNSLIEGRVRGGHDVIVYMFLVLQALKALSCRISLYIP